MKGIISLLRYIHFLNDICHWEDADFKKKVHQNQALHLTEEQLRQIESYWGHLYRSETKYAALYNQFTDSFDPRFLPENLYYLFLDPYLDNARSAQVIDDKNLYDYMLHDVKRPATVARIVHGECYDEEFQPIGIDELICLCKRFGRVIIKPSVLTSGSSGIVILEEKECATKLPQLVSKEKNYIIQEFIEQHEELSSLHKDSINTVRLLALNWRGSVRVLSGIVRMGVNGSLVDNFTVGGISVGIEESGQLKKYAYNLSGERFDRHPQGERFDAHYVPNYQELVNLCTYLTPRFASVSRLISWDFAIGKDGHPVLIEVNLKCGGLDFHQLSNGPVFGDTAKEILSEVFNNRWNRLLRWWYDGIR